MLHLIDYQGYKPFRLLTIKPLGNLMIMMFDIRIVGFIIVRRRIIR